MPYPVAASTRNVSGRNPYLLAILLIVLVALLAGCADPNHEPGRTPTEERAHAPSDEPIESSTEPSDADIEMEAPDAALVGVWVLQDPSETGPGDYSFWGGVPRIDFSADGSWYVPALDVSGSYDLDGHTLILELDCRRREYAFDLDGSDLTIERSKPLFADRHYVRIEDEVSRPPPEEHHGYVATTLPEGYVLVEAFSDDYSCSKVGQSWFFRSVTEPMSRTLWLGMSEGDQQGLVGTILSPPGTSCCEPYGPSPDDVTLWRVDSVAWDTALIALPDSDRRLGLVATGLTEEELDRILSGLRLESRRDAPIDWRTLPDDLGETERPPDWRGHATYGKPTSSPGFLTITTIEDPGYLEELVEFVIGPSPEQVTLRGDPRLRMPEGMLSLIWEGGPGVVQLTGPELAEGSLSALLQGLQLVEWDDAGPILPDGNRPEVTTDIELLIDTGVTVTMPVPAHPSDTPEQWLTRARHVSKGTCLRLGGAPEHVEVVLPAAQVDGRPDYETLTEAQRTLSCMDIRASR